MSVCQSKLGVVVANNLSLDSEKYQISTKLDNLKTVCNFVNKINFMYNEFIARYSSGSEFEAAEDTLKLQFENNLIEYGGIFPNVKRLNMLFDCDYMESIVEVSIQLSNFTKVTKEFNKVHNRNNDYPMTECHDGISYVYTLSRLESRRLSLKGAVKFAYTLVQTIVNNISHSINERLLFPDFILFLNCEFGLFDRGECPICISMVSSSALANRTAWALLIEFSTPADLIQFTIKDFDRTVFGCNELLDEMVICDTFYQRFKLTESIYTATVLDAAMR